MTTKKTISRQNSQKVSATNTKAKAKLKVRTLTSEASLAPNNTSNLVSPSAMEPASLTESAVTDRSDSFNKRKYDTISDEDRLKLILLIKDFGMSCHKASKVLDIAYNNAKVIYRIYKNEKRIR